MRNVLVPTMLLAGVVLSGQKGFNSVHHNTVCGGLFPYSIARGQGSDFNSVHHNTARWITLFGDGNIVHDNAAQLFNIVPGSPANVTFNNAAAAVCP
jgi:hypothetical protein